VDAVSGTAASAVFATRIVWPQSHAIGPGFFFAEWLAAVAAVAAVAVVVLAVLPRMLPPASTAPSTHGNQRPALCPGASGRAVRGLGLDDQPESSWDRESLTFRPPLAIP